METHTISSTSKTHSDASWTPICWDVPSTKYFFSVFFILSIFECDERPMIGNVTAHTQNIWRDMCFVKIIPMYDTLINETLPTPIRNDKETGRGTGVGVTKTVSSVPLFS